MSHPERHSRNPWFPMTLIALMALAAAAALAQPPEPALQGDPDGYGPGFGAEKGPGPGFLAEKLDLSEEQIAQIDKIREEGRKKGLERHKQVLRLRNELEGEMLADQPSRKKVLELNQKLGDLHTQMQADRLTERLAIRELLTPEQRDRMLLMKERGKRGMRGERDRHPGGPGGPDGPENGRMGSGPNGGHRPPRTDCPRVDD